MSGVNAAAIGSGSGVPLTRSTADIGLYEEFRGYKNGLQDSDYGSLNEVSDEFKTFVKDDAARLKRLTEKVKPSMIELGLRFADVKNAATTTRVDVNDLRDKVIQIKDSIEFEEELSDACPVQMLDFTKKLASDKTVLKACKTVLALNKERRLLGDFISGLTDEMDHWMPGRTPTLAPSVADAVEVQHLREALTVLEKRVEVVSTQKNQIPPLNMPVKGSKPSRIAELLAGEELDQNTKDIRAANFQRHLENPIYMSLMSRKIDTSRVLDVDTVEMRNNAQSLVDWKAAMRSQLENLLPESTPCFHVAAVSFCINHFSPRMNGWFQKLKIKGWHALRNNINLFFEYVIGALTPDESDEISYNDFHACFYKDYSNFGAWMNKLDELESLNAGACARYKLTKTIIWKHVDLQSPLEIQKAFQQARYHEDTEKADLRATAKAVEAAHQQIVRAGASNYNYIGDSRSFSGPTAARSPRAGQRTRGGRVFVMNESDDLEFEDAAVFQLNEEDSAAQADHQDLCYAVAASNAAKPFSAFASGAETRVCYRCGVQGHISKDCSNEPRAPAAGRQSWAPAPPNRMSDAFRKPASGFSNPAYKPQSASGGWDKPKPLTKPRIFFKNKEGRVFACTAEEEDKILGGSYPASHLLLIEGDQSGSLFVLA